RTMARGKPYTITAPIDAEALDYMLDELYRLVSTTATSSGPSPSSTVAALDGTGSAGSAATYSRGDDKHGDANRPTTAEKTSLTAIEALGTGVVAKTGTGTYAARTVTAGSGISVSNGDGVSGNPTISTSASIPSPSSTVAALDGTSSAGSAA